MELQPEFVRRNHHKPSKLLIHQQSHIVRPLGIRIKWPNQFLTWRTRIAKLQVGGKGLMTDDVNGCATGALVASTQAGEAFSEAVCSKTAPADSDLAHIIAAWPTLPAGVKGTIVAI